MTTPSFNPPIRTLMGPGPSDVHPRILEALSRPTVGHLDPVFIEMMEQVKELLQYAYQTENPLTMPVSAPGSAGMETCFVNLVEPGDKVIVCQNGVFGGRMKENVERCGGTPVMVEDEWGKAVDLAKVEAALEQHSDAKILAFVHAETSTGARADAKELVALAHRHDCLTIVDSVTSLGGCELKVDEWEIDAIYSGTQKCLSCTPGISPISFNERALQKVRNRSSKVQSWFLDLNLVMGYWGSGQKRAYHHTAPVNALYGLHESLVMLQDEGLENAWERHHKMHDALKAGLEAMGINFIVDELHRLPMLNAVSIPEGVDDASVRSRLLSEYNLEIGAGLGALAGKVWRIGLMGHSAKPENVLLCVGALEAVLTEMNAPINTDVALGKVQHVLL
ncbi:MAG: alanine--glyoxylate aminotransferase [gamma proteobacterium symbiont of Ctena orbiculata]|uniref:Alanine--glyoxylate aminotransferase family protein n=1 Tax=Candidatus Thiodiazotropha taylori TaxID=2792791 RepID=A0A944M5V8_9GAMM|nr:alanine--glyoxylate aminotransferase family protein [Candidatus Thiodiazotropha taylori]PUB88980.1 MAG: alanine--glyoxylate aminotransferase [gamma proteobacterium symbiont of Ctena orbiculata]MBT2988041.1 alanine--glyoxylate aminotransferase family protein [Candidatus Thiodiazotropha taylori]MBT2997678.1 alanine--glyoxylate aminotransferase family protein [Candidatus Thiodiazotropha taylori]MBT3001901.1 alanine--glyoxylate aminotransferase family protein [Candidatus Thiodiazotropha taylori]